MKRQLHYEKDVVRVGRRASIQEAASLMRERHVGDVVVVDEDEGRQVPIGILTDRDIVVELIAEGVPVDNVRVEDVMTTEIVVAHSTQSLKSLISLMRLRGVRRIPIVDPSGALEGIISADDVMEEIAHEIASLAKLPRHQRKNEEDLRGRIRA